MDRYSCRLLNRDGSDDMIDLGRVADDAAAHLAVRSALLVSLTAASAQLWRNGALLANITRDVAQFRSRPEPSRAGWGGGDPRAPPA